MDIISRKLNLFQEFLRISDEKLIDKLESILKAEMVKNADMDFKPMTINQFQDMVDKAEDDISKGKVTETDDLLKKVEKWH